MELALDIASAVLLAVGGYFFLVGAIGLNRMPDVFTRMHAVSVSETMGVGLMIAGMCLQSGMSLVTVKLFFILIVLWFTGAVATHALARAALHDGEKPLLVNQRGVLTKTDPVDLYPELGVRLATPLVSETVEEPVEEPASDSDKEDAPSNS